MIEQFKICEFGHKTHKTVEVPTELGTMRVYDWSEYENLPSGQCAGRDDISRTLINTGRWEPIESAVIRDILEKGDRNSMFIDVGCNVGWYSKMANNLDYDVWAVDCIQESLNLTKINTNDAVECSLIWFDDKTQPIADFPGQKVPYTKKIELLKIDIEGAEQYAYNYFEQIIDRVKNIFIEVTPVFNDSYPALMQRIKNAGFTIYNLDGTLFDFKYDFNQVNLICRREK